jgi:hypothetical protein
MQEGFPNPEFVLSPELNERAITLVLNSVIRYPQAGEASGIMSSRLIEEFDPNPASATGVGIREAIRICPDPSDAANRINEVHERFGIKRQVCPDEADFIVRATATMAVDNIRWTLHHVGKWNHFPSPVPASLLEMPLYATDENGPVKPLQILPNAADALYDYLLANPQLRTQTTHKLAADAAKFRDIGKDWRKQVQYNHAHGKPIR